MNINWKARLTSKTFWVAIVSAIVLLTQQLGINIFPSNWADIFNTVLTIFIILGVIVDTSTVGISDYVAPVKTSNDISGQVEKVQVEATTTAINNLISQNSKL